MGKKPGRREGVACYGTWGCRTKSSPPYSGASHVSQLYQGDQGWFPAATTHCLSPKLQLETGCCLTSQGPSGALSVPSVPSQPKESQSPLHQGLGAGMQKVRGRVEDTELGVQVRAMET